MAYRPEGLRWSLFVDLATDYLVAPAIAHCFEQHSAGYRVPDLVERYFSSTLQLNRSRNLRIRDEATMIAAALNRIDVVPVFLKGSAGLLQGLYTEPGARIMSDLDVLVPPGRSEECGACLSGLGYRAAPLDKSAPHNLGSFSSQSFCAPVDLHGAVLAVPNEGFLSPEDVVAGAIELRNGDAVYAVPNETHQIMLNVGHAQLSDSNYAYGRLPLRAFYDLALLAAWGGNRIDWPRIESRFAANGSRIALTFHLLATRELLGFEFSQSPAPGQVSRMLFHRARYTAVRPRLQRLSDRFVRITVLLKRELSRPERRRRLWHNMASAAWWRRHMRVFLKGWPPRGVG